MANLYYIKRALYVLKKEFGFSLDLYRLARADTDLTTGKKTMIRTKYSVRRAIMIKNPTIQRKFSYDLSYLAANKNFTYGALYDTESATFLIAAADLPRGFELTEDDYAVYNHKKYNLVSFQLLEHKMAYLADFKQAKGVQVAEIHDVRVASNLAIDQGLSNAN